MLRIAVDAMGADNAPHAEVEGALAAVRERPVEVVLVGETARLTAEIERLGGPHPHLKLHQASQVITMHDHPATAVKGKKDASMRVAFDLARAGEVQAVVSAGNSGAMVACGLFVTKRIAGVERPAIATLAPTRLGDRAARGQAVVLDIGANTEPKPQALAVYAVIGTVYAQKVLGVARPRVAVLSNGEEETKGTALTREAHRLLSSARAPAFAADFDFVGYVEGKDFFDGSADVVVTDGFTGNVALKTFEGAVRAIGDFLRAEAKGGALRVKLGALLMKPAFELLKRTLAWDEIGGAPLLGIDGVAIICHGRSNAKAIKNGIFTAEKYARAGLAPAIAEAVARHAPLWAAPVDAADGIQGESGAESGEPPAPRPSAPSSQKDDTLA